MLLYSERMYNLLWLNIAQRLDEYFISFAFKVLYNICVDHV